jgi:Fanconi anemia group M protein
LKVLSEFRKGEFSTLVSTSISEEGLDIPSIDTAIFFEPVPSALRTVQRKGRVGRAKTGNVYVLITKGTVDEKYKWVAYYKEKRMRKAIKNINRNDLTQSDLKSFIT